MSKIAGIVLMCAMIAGCGSTADLPSVVVKDLQIKDLAPKPAGHMMEAPEDPTPIPLGSKKGDATPIITKNNLIAVDNAGKVRDLQRTINELFK